MDFNMDLMGDLAFTMGISFIVVSSTSLYSNPLGIFIAGVIIFFIGIIIKTIFKFRIEKYTIFNKKCQEVGFMIKDLK